MRISELPQDIKELALKYRSNNKKGLDKFSDSLQDAFWWDETVEGFNYWNEWDDKEATKETLTFQKLETIIKNKREIEFDSVIENWLNTDTPMPLIQANDINATLQYLFDTYKD